jgi:transposase
VGADLGSPAACEGRDGQVRDRRDWDKVLAALQVQADARGEIDWRVSVDSTSSRVHQHGATASRLQGGRSSHTGAGPSYKDPPDRVAEPEDHAIGRSRGGLTTKTHALVHGNGMPLVIAVTPGQANDSPALPKLLAELRIPRVGPGRPRTTPEALRADKAYSARGHRAHLRSRGITAVVPEPSDQIRHRQNKGSRGGRPVAFDASV